MYSECINAVIDGFTLLIAVNASEGASSDVFQIRTTAASESECFCVLHLQPGARERSK
jgi:hypothetical protein